MTVSHTNRRGQTYYLHEGKAKGGKSTYFFSMKRQGTLVDEVPEGFEIYEHPRGQVYLRRILPKLITEQEVAIVEREIKRFPRLQHHLVDVKKDIISIFLPDQDVAALSGLFVRFSEFGSSPTHTALEEFLSYSPMMQFVLVDAEKREFMVQRYCFLGSIDDWIVIGTRDTLPRLASKYIKHLGKDSYFDLS